MGEFVAASAFRTHDAKAVRDAAVGFFSAYSWPAEPFDGADPVTKDDVLIYSPVNGWTVVVWPGYFTELVAVEFMSRQLGCLTSTVHIYDGDYWSHALVRDGVVLDRFASVPDYFTDDPEEIARLRAKYAGQPAVVAEAIGCSVEQVAPYLVHVNMGDGEDEDGYYVDEPELGRAFPDDEFELDSVWVFVDLWNRLGPRYPDDVLAYLARIRLAANWLNELPTGDAEL